MDMSDAKEAALAGPCRENTGDLLGYFVVRRMLLYGGKSSKFLQTGQADEMTEKVAKNEILGVRNCAKKCHLRADKRTKSTDKVSVLFQTFT